MILFRLLTEVFADLVLEGDGRVDVMFAVWSGITQPKLFMADGDMSMSLDDSDPYHCLLSHAQIRLKYGRVSTLFPLLDSYCARSELLRNSIREDLLSLIPVTVQSKAHQFVDVDFLAMLLCRYLPDPGIMQRLLNYLEQRNYVELYRKVFQSFKIIDFQCQENTLSMVYKIVLGRNINIW